MDSLTFPLSRDAFAAALRTGHGRVVQQLERHGAAGLEDLIIEACLTCQVHDPQAEAARTPWLFSIIERARLQAAVLSAIEARGAGSPDEDPHDLAQRHALLALLAAAGLDNARSVLYAAFAQVPEAALAIVDLDGADGMIHVSRQLGQWLRADPDFWVDDYLHTRFSASPDAENGLARLDQAAVSDPDIAHYLAEVRKTQDGAASPSASASRSTFSVNDILDHLDSKPADPCHWLRGWGAQASDDQREAAFRALLDTRQPERARRLFNCFARTGVPRLDQRLLGWLDQGDPALRRTAVKALAPLKHPDLRNTAKRLLGEGDIANGLALLVNNFVQGDFAIVEDCLSRPGPADELHRVMGELLRLSEHASADEAPGCLLYVYEHSPCSTCRKHAVQALIDRKAVPEWVLAESALDADPDTRALTGSSPS